MILRPKMDPEAPPEAPQKETKIHQKSLKNRLWAAVGAHRRLLGGCPQKVLFQENQILNIFSRFDTETSFIFVHFLFFVHNPIAFYEGPI